MSDGAVLLVRLDPVTAPGGRATVSQMHQAVLADLFGERLVLFHPHRTGAPSAADALRGRIDGLDGATLASLCATIRAEDVRQVFIDGSNLGAAAAAIKRACPEVRVVTFFHNVEARFFLGAFRSRPGVRVLAVTLAHYAAERLAVRWSDTLVCLSARDSAGLARLYGRAADAISALALADTFSADHRAPADPGPYLLFVGGGFYANLDGIAWFGRHVAPHLPLRTVIVGRGMEILAAPFAGTPQVEVIGAVDDLSPWYRNAYLVVAPIFDGSGMKTKVAEALMYGKAVVGTAEAFSGYARDVVASGWQCESADSFRAAIDEALAAGLPVYSAPHRALYDRFHSFAAARARMAAIMAPP